jgi:hypothetical protein
MSKGQENRVHPEIDLEQVKRLSGQGLTVKQIGHCIGYSKSSLYNKLDVLDAIKEGRSQGINQVTNALFDSATGGNVTAQIFFLKNRQPDKWRDRRETEVTGKDGGPIQLLPFEFVDAEDSKATPED